MHRHAVLLATAICLTLLIAYVAWSGHRPDGGLRATSEGTQDAIRLPIVTDVPDLRPLTPPRVPPPGYAEYRSEFYRFQLLYPKELSFKEHTENYSSRTVTFQNNDSSWGFQIYITPYGEAQISPERFRTDIPSMVRMNDREITVDGVRAALFDSTDSVLGETVEIWFIAKGFLYEITARREMKHFLEELLTNWMFLTRQ
jgi:hypothetical protein